MSQQPERTYTYLDAPHLAGTPNAFDSDLCASFSFGISGKVSALPDRATSRGAHFRDVRQITEGEANELLATRIRGKTAAAVRQGPERSRLLYAHLVSWRFDNPTLQQVLAEALASLSAAIAPAASQLQPTDTVAKLQADIATMSARLAALEGARP